MRATAVCACCTILVSFALTIVGFPENSVRENGEPENPLTTLNLSPAAIDGRSPIPIYNPAIAFERDENHRAKRHLFKKKKAKKAGYQQVQSPPVVIINQYGGGHGGGHGKGYDGGYHIQPRQPVHHPQPVYHPQPVQVQNTGWGWRR